MTNRDKWAQRYEARKALIQPFLNKGAKHEKQYTCKICGMLYYESEETEHEANHTTEPPDKTNYCLPISYREANGLINQGETFIGLLINHYRNKFVETWYNAMLLQNNTRLIDFNNTSVKWDAKKRKFYRCLWYVALLLTIELFSS